MLLMELFEELSVSDEELQILESVREFYIEHNKKLVQNKITGKKNKKSDEILNLSKPQKIVVEGFNNVRK